MADDSTRRDLQPDGVLPDAGSPFLPVTPGGWILCAFFFSVAVVALCHAANDVGAFRDALQHKDIVAEITKEDNGFNGSGGDDVEVVTGDDGKQYYDVSRLVDREELSGNGSVRAMAKRSAGSASEMVLEKSCLSVRNLVSENCPFYAGVLKICAGCSDGQEEIRQSSKYVDLACWYCGEHKQAARNGFCRSLREEIEPVSFENHALISYGAIVGFDSVYRFDRSISYATNPYTAFGQWVGSKWVSSSIYRKLMSNAAASTVAAVLTFGAMTGGCYVADELIGERSAAMQEVTTEYIERITPELTEACMAVVEDGATVTTADMSLALMETGMSAASRGATLTTEELLSETASNYLTMQRGQSGEFVTDAFVEKLAQGLVSCDQLPLLSNFGQTICELCGYSLSDDLEFYPDADGFSGSGGDIAEYNGDEYSYNSSLNGIRYKQKTSSTYIDLKDSTNPDNPVYFYYDKRNNADGFGMYYYYGTRHVLNGVHVNLDQLESLEFGPNVIYLGDYRPNLYTMPAYADRPSGQALSGLVDGINSQSFFDAGGQLVGNDAQFGDNGELLDSGNADVSTPLYSDNYNPGSWNEVLYDAGVNAVQPAENTTYANNEVIAGNKVGETIYDAVNANKASPPPKTVPQLQFMVDGSMGDLQSAVSDKFPFSVPFNISKVVNGLVATPEAPHFTWVFDVPTGDVEYEVDLSPFSPVAHVLRVMLDVLLVFSVVSLLGKIAEVWGFFDKSAD